MTAAAPIHQADIARAIRALGRAGVPGRVRLDLRSGAIDIIVGESHLPGATDALADVPDANPWDDVDDGQADAA